MDKLTAEARSANMRRIHSKNTEPEVMVRSLLHGMGLRFRLHVKHMPGNPDIVLTRHGKVVFVHGCFWHQHSTCREGRIPGTRHEYWVPKLARNVQRDAEHRKALRTLGWKSLVVWECEFNDPKRLISKLNRFLI